MMRFLNYFWLVLVVALLASATVHSRTISDFEKSKHQVNEIRKLTFKGFPEAYNPSLIASKDGLILVFRFHPKADKLHISNICVVQLNELLEPISEPQVLNTRDDDSPVPSQAEDARIFSYCGELYLIYNDNIDVEGHQRPMRRNLFIAKLKHIDDKFFLEKPVKLFHAVNFERQLIEKNWSPFEWNNHLLLTYTISPHEVLRVNLASGCCEPIYCTESGFYWKWGGLRGGTPARVIDGEYFAFSHSWAPMSSRASQFTSMVHYVAGAYTFNPDPPFEIRRVTPVPIICDSFYTQSDYWKRVIYPGGYAKFEDHVYLAYGRDDREIWIAKLSWKDIQDHLVPVKTGN